MIPLQGSAPSLFVSTSAFEVIVKQQIKRLDEPTVKCCQMVYDEMIRILGHLLNKVVRGPFHPFAEPPFDLPHSKLSDDSQLYASDSTLLSSTTSRGR